MLITALCFDCIDKRHWHRNLDGDTERDGHIQSGHGLTDRSEKSLLKNRVRVGLAVGRGEVDVGVGFSNLWRLRGGCRVSRRGMRGGIEDLVTQHRAGWPNSRGGAGWLDRLRVAMDSTPVRMQNRRTCHGGAVWRWDVFCYGCKNVKNMFRKFSFEIIRLFYCS